MAVPGLALDLVVDGAAVSVTFSAAPRPTLRQALDQIKASSPWVDGFVFGGQLFLQTRMVGSGASISAMNSTAASILGIAGSASRGRDGHMALSPLQERYTFDDPDYLDRRRYLYALYNSATGEYSDSVGPFASTDLPSATVEGYLDIVDSGGRPIANRAVLLMLADGQAGGLSSVFVGNISSINSIKLISFNWI